MKYALSTPSPEVWYTAVKAVHDRRGYVVVNMIHPRPRNETLREYGGIDLPACTWLRIEQETTRKEYLAVAEELRGEIKPPHRMLSIGSDWAAYDGNLVVEYCRYSAPMEEGTVSWSIGFDTRWNRDIGYGVPAVCDHPECSERIDRGLGYVCGFEEPYGGEQGCGLYFCAKHGAGALCERCCSGASPFPAKPDIADWDDHKMNDPSWEEWRQENPDLVATLS